jgi:hypothetical protein
MGGRVEAREFKAKPFAFGSFRREDRPGSPGPVLFWPRQIRAHTSNPEPAERSLDPGQVACAEQPDVHERWVEVVEVAAQLVEARF